MAITYKEVDILQEFKADNMDICIKVWEQLVGKGEHILVSYRTNMDDPRDVTFVVGATDNDHLHEFILKHVRAICLLSRQAQDHLVKYYLHGNRNFVVIPGPEGTEHVKYYDVKQVREGNERNSSWWYDCTYDRTFTKMDILDNEFCFTLHTFVKIRD
jgi:hypothetical protein